MSSIRFSKSIYLALEDDHLVLSAKVSNVRRQTVLNPAVRLLLALEVPREGDTCEEEAGYPLCLMVRFPRQLRAALRSPACAARW